MDFSDYLSVYPRASNVDHWQLRTQRFVPERYILTVEQMEMKEIAVCLPVLG